MTHCILCKTPVQQKGDQWVCERDVLAQYCWVDPVHGSQLHEPMLTIPNDDSKM